MPPKATCEGRLHLGGSGMVADLAPAEAKPEKNKAGGR